MLVAADMLQVEFGITVEAGMLKEIAVEYAKSYQATHVVLGRKLRKEAQYFIKNLSCGISMIKSDHTIQILRAPQIDEAGTKEGVTTNQKNREGWDSSHLLCCSCRNTRPWYRQKMNFTYAELQIATNGFCSQNLMSDHGSKAYLGMLNGQRKILIRETPSVTMGEEDYQREVRMLEGVRHSNVALLIGSCSGGPNRFLVYEYICNGSLNTHLSDENKKLTWEIRINIAYGAAKGLAYLHEEGIYGSMRPSNILVTHDFQPMLSYYGFMTEYETSGERSGKRSAMKTFEHLAPEYDETGKEVSKADVFAFGVVLLELITGRKTIEDTDGQSYLRWARPLLRQKKYTELTDPTLKDSPDVYQLYWLVRMADKCLSLDPKSRYSMNKVVKALSDVINRCGVEEFSPTESEL
ncbi:probable serine/threonine-protein kinase PBL23 isoform X2 [Salvia splendens]|nr:probable serine/threonine-protein kinase PBL23 isoform X2 [Salvia splendens]